MVESTFSTHELNKISSVNPDRPSALPTSHKKNMPPDEIIFSLANTYENKRARQVTEWERVQAANIRRAM